MFIKSFGNFLNQGIYENVEKLLKQNKVKQASKRLRKVLETFKAKQASKASGKYRVKESFKVLRCFPKKQNIL